MSVALSIAFTGLCALVADGTGTPGEVLLVDAVGIGEVGGAILPEHAPTLVVNLRDLANPDSSGPTRVVGAWSGESALEAVGGDSTPGRAREVDQIAMWDLRGTVVRIRAQGTEGTGVQLFSPLPSDTSWPQAPPNAHDPAGWRDPRFIADMGVISGDGRVHPSLIGTDGDTEGSLPRAVAARIYLDAGVLEGGLPSQELHREDLFEFRNATSGRSHRQAMTDTIRWTLRTDTNAVLIEIVPVAGGPTKRLLLAPSATPHRVFISNLPAENPSHADTHSAMSDEDMSALHFAAYYKLLMNEPVDTPLPELWRSHRDRKGTGFLRPATCPGARFTRP